MFRYFLLLTSAQRRRGTASSWTKISRSSFHLFVVPPLSKGFCSDCKPTPFTCIRSSRLNSASMSYPPRSDLNQSQRQTAFHYPSSIHSSTSNISPTLPSFSSSPTAPIPQLKSTTSLSNLFEENHPDLPPPPRKRRFQFVHPAQWNWRKAEDTLWASLPVLFHLTTIGLMSFALFQNCIPYISLVQVVGGGRVDYGIYRKSCVFLEIVIEVE